jgi:hypothetical protein
MTEEAGLGAQAPPLVLPMRRRQLALVVSSTCENESLCARLQTGDLLELVRGEIQVGRVRYIVHPLKVALEVVRSWPVLFFIPASP